MDGITEHRATTPRRDERVGVRVLIAPDKFRGTATAADVAGAAESACARLGNECVRIPMSDGGEGLLDALGGANRRTTVTGPLGTPVEAAWRIDPDGRAVVEAAQACGLQLAGGRNGNDPIGATTTGVGELVVAAVRAGASSLLIGVGGSATTDGGAAAVRVIERAGIALGSMPAQVCSDVDIRFTEAARLFGGQKGATPAQIEALTERLRSQRDHVLARSGLDLDSLPGSGAAGGLAGGLAVLGCEIVAGFATVAGLVGLDVKLREAALVITGEGRFDRTSLHGKVVGGLIEMTRDAGTPLLVLAGERDREVAVPANVHVVSLTERFGRNRSRTDTLHCVAAATEEHLRTAGHDAEQAGST
jgi:glycerate 2-kinase